jgi:hypothetical protein
MWGVLAFIFSNLFSILLFFLYGYLKGFAKGAELEKQIQKVYTPKNNEEQEVTIVIIKNLLGHCRALKGLVYEDVPKLNENIAMAEKFLREVEINGNSN